MYSLEIKKGVDGIFSRLDRGVLEALDKKIAQILESPHRFKPLRKPLHGLRRVHVDGSFVLVYSVDEDRKVVTIWDYAHHDRVYMHRG